MIHINPHRSHVYGRPCRSPWDFTWTQPPPKPAEVVAAVPVHKAPFGIGRVKA